MLSNILNAANLYADGVKRVQDRKDQWLKKHVELKVHLKEIADYLNVNAAYKQEFFIDTLHAFNDDINGICAEMPSVTFRSGDMPMLISFKNGMGEKKEYMEEGFEISFTPSVTGQIIVTLYPHFSDLDKEPPEFVTLGVIDFPETLTMDTTDELISKGIETAFYTSFTGMDEGEQNELPVPSAHHIIGFKRYETTEKIKS